jgi:hypothetical protein
MTTAPTTLFGTITTDGVLHLDRPNGLPPGRMMVHLAAAVEFGASRFLTHDHRRDAFTDLVVEVLS